MIDRHSPISYGEPDKADRPIVHRGIRSKLAYTTADLNVAPSDATTSNKLENYLKDLERKKKGINEAWDNNAHLNNRSIDTLPNVTTSVIDTEFSFPSTSRYKTKQTRSSPYQHDSVKVNESEKTSKRFSTPLLDMPTPTRIEVAELETEINASPFQRIQEWRSETIKNDEIDVPVRWELKQWHTLEYWYDICDNNVQEAAQAFYEHESVIHTPIEGSSQSSLRRRWSLEEIRRRCQCLDTNIRYNNGISPRKRRRRGSTSSVESRSSTASSWASMAGQAINKVASRLFPKRPRISRHASNLSIDDKSSTASVNVRLNRLWTEDRSKPSSRRPSIERLLQKQYDVKPNLSSTNFDESKDSIADHILHTGSHKERPKYKEITPERELTPPNLLRVLGDTYDKSLRTKTQWRPSKRLGVNDDHEPQLPVSDTKPRHLHLGSDGRKPPDYTASTKRMEEEGEEKVAKYKVPTDSAGRVKVNWREDPAATPRRGRVQKLLNQLEHGLPLEDAEFEKNVPVYSSLDSSLLS